MFEVFSSNFQDSGEPCVPPAARRAQPPLREELLPQARRQEAQQGKETKQNHECSLGYIWRLDKRKLKDFTSLQYLVLKTKWGLKIASS